ncbi:MATE family efflux transporter [Geobacillus subterraneus]|uniref:Probable multidrug resistance protein NorM n=2 Tax=Geobacillus TaxID=129337 RepID=A0ABM6ABP4_9BACL|nr:MULTISPECIES: MATE family efflux transporter [Geobacillus]AMX83720.1 MATE family efflux transporter [Geobacillus subterraneus]KZS24423.1 MATE family efflux transporter [Geobacillus subterraneus]OXB87934.1 MATE family multidrug exporter [Geobacillus uzenensis]
MAMTAPAAGKWRRLFALFLPIFVSQAGQYMMNFTDVAMSGHASAEDLAGVAIGSSLWVPVFTGVGGILLALSPIVSQHFGAGRHEDISRTVIQALYLSVAIALALVLAGAVAVSFILEQMQLEESVRYIASHYLLALSLGIIPLFLYAVLRYSIDALGQTKVTMWITLTALPINMLFNWLFIYGHGGFPRLGGIGTGYATAITYTYCFVSAALVAAKFRRFAPYRAFARFYRPSWATWKELLKTGVPIGSAIFFETSIFAAVTLLVGRFGAETVAAHQSALNFASLLYMIPLSLSMALTIAVGFEAGAKRYEDAKQFCRIGIAIALAVAAAAALFLYAFRGHVARLYTNDPAVAALTGKFLLYAIFFQFSDAIAAPIQGALRGYKDVNAVFWAALLAYWGIGLPVGCALALLTAAGAFGYWIGLITGLAAGALFLSFRLRAIWRRHGSRRTPLAS